VPTVVNYRCVRNIYKARIQSLIHHSLSLKISIFFHSLKKLYQIIQFFYTKSQVSNHLSYLVYMFIILVVVYFLVFDLFFLIELCYRSEMLLRNIMNTCYNGVILLKFIKKIRIL